MSRDEQKRDLGRRIASGDESVRHELDLLEEAEDGAAAAFERTLAVALAEDLGESVLRERVPRNKFDPKWRLYGEEPCSYLECALESVERLLLDALGSDLNRRLGQGDWDVDFLVGTEHTGGQPTFIVAARGARRLAVEFSTENAWLPAFRDEFAAMWAKGPRERGAFLAGGRGRAAASEDAAMRWARLRRQSPRRNGDAPFLGDAEMRDLERRYRADPSDASARAAYLDAWLASGGRDPRLDPTPGDAMLYESSDSLSNPSILTVQSVVPTPGGSLAGDALVYFRFFRAGASGTRGASGLDPIPWHKSDWIRMFKEAPLGHVWAVAGFPSLLPPDARR